MKMNKVVLSTLLATTVLVGCKSEKRGDVEVIDSDQFALENITYKPGVHKGMGQYKAKSMYGTKKVALTFDDGPHPVHTPKVLDLLKEKDAKATFFVMGRLATKYPKIIQRMKDEGHIVALHAYITHDNSNALSKKKFDTALVNSVKSVRKAGWTDEKELYYRFPYGAYGSKKLNYHHFESFKELGQKLYGENCFNFVFWDIDTSDWYLKKFKNGPELIAETTMAYLDGGKAYDFWYHKKHKKARKIKNGYEGGVILLHDIHGPSVKATELILDQLEENNYEVVPLNEVEEFEYEDNKRCNLDQPNY